MRKCLAWLLSLVALSVLGIALTAFLPLKNAPLVGMKGDYSLQHVNIIDTISGDILSDMTVLIEQGRIREIIPGSQYQPRSNFV